MQLIDPQVRQSDQSSQQFPQESNNERVVEEPPQRDCDPTRSDIKLSYLFRRGP